MKKTKLFKRLHYGFYGLSALVLISGYKPDSAYAYEPQAMATLHTNNQDTAGLIYEETPGIWHKDAHGWWYELASGGYAKNQWIYTNGEHYLFGPDGYMLNGWQYFEGKWYYLGATTGKLIENDTYEKDTIKGVDVSYWQKDVDWGLFKASGINFAFARAGYGHLGSHGNNDSYFEKNMKNANEAGIATGVYYYSTATTVSQAILDARFVINRMQGLNVSYPVAIDMEDDATQGQLSPSKNAQIARAFCDEIKAAGYTPMIYCNENWYNNYIDMSQLTDIDTWIARFDLTRSPEITAGIWQSSASTIRPDGKNYDSGPRIDYVDLDFAYKDYSTIVTPRTKMLETYDINRKVLCRDENGVWLFCPDGSFAKDAWEIIDGHYYRFDSNGYALIGWQYIGADWYYFQPDGKMTINEWVDGYYLNEKGQLTDAVPDNTTPPDTDSNTDTSDNSDNSDNSDTNDNSDNTDTTKEPYVPEKSGSWISAKGRWWFKHDDGSYTANGWEKIKQKWYYFDASGWMKTGWIKDGNDWYYLSNNGDMTTGWFEVKGIWYYSNEKGVLATSTYVDDIYYVNSDGAYVAKKTAKGNSYIGVWKSSGNRWWFQHDDRSYAKNGWELINDEWYYFDASGWMKTGWINDYGSWYYCDGSGKMLTSQWIGSYYVNEKGLWVQ